jgi:hypothetical protein
LFKLKKEIHFTNFNQNIPIIIPLELKINDQKYFAAHLEEDHGTPVEKHCTTQLKRANEGLRIKV